MDGGEEPGWVVSESDRTLREGGRKGKEILGTLT